MSPGMEHSSIEITNKLAPRWQRAAVQSAIRIAVPRRPVPTRVVVAPKACGQKAEVRMFEGGALTGLLLLPLADDPNVFATNLLHQIRAAYPMRQVAYARLPTSV
jgi:hypothetical protein